MAGSALGDMLARGHIEIGLITGSAGAGAVLTSNAQKKYVDTLTRNAAGDYTITFGEPFSSIPYADACPIAAFANNHAYCVNINTITASAVRFQILDAAPASGAIAMADVDFRFILIGYRDV